MYQFERIEKIIEKIRRTGQIKISEEAKVLDVSFSTLHRDLNHIEKMGFIKKVRGGAVFQKSSPLNTHLENRLNIQVKEKTEIAERAVEMIRDDTSIFLDHSSSVLYLAKELKRRMFRNLIIFTNSLALPKELGDKKGVRVIMTGGVVEYDFMALSGNLVIDFLRRVNLHQVFASVGALSIERGLMTQMSFIHDVLKQIFNLKPEINILADSSKFYKVGTFEIIPINKSLRIFTDKGLPSVIKDEIEKKGAKVITC